MTWVKYPFIVLFMSLLSACAFLKEPLRYESVLGLHVIENPEHNVVRISGLCGSSAMAVYEIHETRRGDIKVINIMTGPANREHPSGLFSVDVAVSPDVQGVELGGHVIWSRPLVSGQQR